MKTGLMKRKFINENEAIYCPICKSWCNGSEYLRGVFSDPKPYWLACMVTHYRHNHIRYYNRWVHYHSRHGRYDWFKAQVNNRIKRNILGKCKKFLREHRFTVQDFALLQNTEQKTLDKAHKILGGNPITLNKPKPHVVTLDKWLE